LPRRLLSHRVTCSLKNKFFYDGFSRDGKAYKNCARFKIFYAFGACRTGDAYGKIGFKGFAAILRQALSDFCRHALSFFEQALGQRKKMVFCLQGINDNRAFKYLGTPRSLSQKVREVTSCARFRGAYGKMLFNQGFYQRFYCRHKLILANLWRLESQEIFIVKASGQVKIAILMEGVIRAKLIERIKRTPTVESFRFLPQGKVDFLPGQFTRLFFDTANKSNSDLNKYLSFSCGPSHDYLEVTKRLSESAFSQHLKSLQRGDEVVLGRPMGNCIFKDHYRKIAFLTGGIGITPAISIIEYIVKKKIDADVALLYANRNEEEIAFRAELDAWQKNFKKLKICYTVSCKTSSGSVCREGNIDVIFCRSNLSDLDERKVFIYGPPAMVTAIQGLVMQLDCKKENVLTENFIGY